MNVVYTLADAFKLVHHSLLKLSKYEGLINQEEQEIEEINQTVYIAKDIGGIDNIKESNKCILNKTNKNYTYWGYSWKFGTFGHLAKDCNSTPMDYEPI